MFILTHTGNLVNYEDHTSWCIIRRNVYYRKWLKLLKWQDGTWKAGLIIGYFRNKIIVEIGDGDDADICTVKREIVYEWEDGFAGKKWRK